MRFLYKVSSLYKSSLLRGFFFITNILLGIGLEQGLIKSPSISLEISFLIGLIFGLYLGFFCWQGHKFLESLCLNFWFIEGLLVGFLLWREACWLSFLQGLFFGPLMLHVFLISEKYSFDELFLNVSLGIILGNIFLFFAKKIPHEIAIICLSALLVGWRLEKPKSMFDEKNFFVFNKKNIPFWFFILIFYLMGGFYYSALFVSFSIPASFFDIISFISYSGAIVLSIFLIRLYRYFSMIAILIVGLSLVWQLSSYKFTELSLSLLEIGFAFADIFSLTYILLHSSSLFEAAFSFSLFPFSILLSLLFLIYVKSSFLREYQWALTGIFLAIPPSLLLIKLEKIFFWQQRFLALPPARKFLPLNQKRVDSSKADTSTGIKKKLEIDWQRFNELDLPLSKREKEVFIFLLKDYKIKDISYELKLAIGTVKSITNRIYEKLKVKNKKELIQKYNFLLFS